jgi:uncharacterized protein
MHINRRFATLLMLLFLILQGCTPLKPDRQAATTLDPYVRDQVNLLLNNQSYEAAASLLQTLAGQSESPLREQLYLEAAETWIKAGNLEQTNQLLPHLQAPSDDLDYAFRLRMLRTAIAIQHGDIDTALDLMEPSPGAETPNPLRQRYHQNMAEIFRLSGNLLESARELNELDILQAGETQQGETQALLVQTLASMTDTALQLLQPPPPSHLIGWMELARIVKQQIVQPAELAQALAGWRQRFPDHPALQSLLAGYLEQKGLSSSDHIAILLPRSGPYVHVARAVRDGFMAAWYQQPLEYRPQLRFYDSSNVQDTLRLYQQAVLQGAQMVVGPLDKDAVNMLMQLESLPQPVLALNQIEDESRSIPMPNLYQFGLAPEDEAEQVAERAWLEGHQRALILTPSDHWGQRIAERFRLRWESLGGSVLEQRAYEANANDFSQPIRALLNVDESEARIHALEQQLGVKLEADSRRREDADFIFLAARPQKGRQLRPQLKFHHAGDLPIYATSHIYSGIADAEQDRDLGHINFVDTPWLLEDETQSPLSRKNLQQLLPGVKGQYARLYAMGIDSYNLLANLDQLQSQSGRTFSGKSGTLYLDAQHRLHRLLAWAEMDQGLAKITGYAPRMPSPLPGQAVQPEAMQPADFAGQTLAPEPTVSSPQQ